MPIEFRCTNCSKLLRTGDDTAGRQAQCPDCGALMTIPGETAPASVPPPSAPGDSPFAKGAPYQPVIDMPGGSSAADRVSGPATALIVTAWIGIALQAVSIVANLVSMGRGAAVGPFPGRHQDIFPAMVGGGVGLAMAAIQLALGVVILIGATKMKRLEGYGFAMAAAIIAMIPCLSPCCLLGLPFGIWAIVVLSDSSVKAAFRS